MKTKHAVAHAMVVSFALGAVAVPVDYAVAQAWWTVAGQSQTINAEPSASLKAFHHIPSHDYRALSFPRIISARNDDAILTSELVPVV